MYVEAVWCSGVSRLGIVHIRAEAGLMSRALKFQKFTVSHFERISRQQRSSSMNSVR